MDCACCSACYSSNSSGKEEETAGQIRGAKFLREGAERFHMCSAALWKRPICCVNNASGVFAHAKQMFRCRRWVGRQIRRSPLPPTLPPNLILIMCLCVLNRTYYQYLKRDEKIEAERERERCGWNTRKGFYLIKKAIKQLTTGKTFFFNFNTFRCNRQKIDKNCVIFWTTKNTWMDVHMNNNKAWTKEQRSERVAMNSFSSATAVI